MALERQQSKNLALDLLRFTGEVTEDGGPIKRTSFDKDHLRGVNSLRDKLVECVEVGTIPEESKEESDVVWVKATEYKPVEGHRLLGERFTENSLDVTKKESEALSWCYKGWAHITAVTTQTLDDIEELIAS